VIIDGHSKIEVLDSALARLVAQAEGMISLLDGEISVAGREEITAKIREAERGLYFDATMIPDQASVQRLVKLICDARACHETSCVRSKRYVDG
jgi:hypothetical protein